jgi:hypothetical protein
MEIGAIFVVGLFSIAALSPHLAAAWAVSLLLPAKRRRVFMDRIVLVWGLLVIFTGVALLCDYGWPMWVVTFGGYGITGTNFITDGRR